MILRFYEQLSVAETADFMECPQGTVKALTHRAIKRLQSDVGVWSPALASTASSIPGMVGDFHDISYIH